jgi:dTDP-4-dehydrorhamnose 3,5-epimerase/reductase
VSSGYFIVGSNGQVGLALRAKYPDAQFADAEQLDITNEESVQNFDWSSVTHILNAAAYTNVDGAETPEGKVAAWDVNATAVAHLAKAATLHDLTLIHISTDYVFDGSRSPHTEDEPFSPLSVYGASKAAGDKEAAKAPKHYIVRTSWVIGEGKNFVRTMLELGTKGVNPSVVSDQIGRLTFTTTLAEAIDHLLTTQSPYGTYNVTNEGEPASWADITRKIFEIAGLKNTVTDVTTDQYYEGKVGIAPRPLKSTLSLDKIKAAGYTPADWLVDLKKYIAAQN